jgi:hypothetical protein
MKNLKHILYPITYLSGILITVIGFIDFMSWYYPEGLSHPNDCAVLSFKCWPIDLIMIICGARACYTTDMGRVDYEW